MERPSFYLSPFVDVKPRNIHIPPYPPVSPGAKQPVTPIPRVPATKPTSSYRIDDILSKPDPRPPVSMPTAALYRSYPATPPRRYSYGPNVSYLWSSMLQSQWRERYNGMLHVSPSYLFIQRDFFCPTLCDNYPHSRRGIKITVYFNTFRAKTFIPSRLNSYCAQTITLR